MTTTPNPMTAPLIIASLTIGTPSTIMLDTMIELINCYGMHFTTAEANSIMTAAERLDDDEVTTRIADALAFALKIND